MTHGKLVEMGVKWLLGTGRCKIAFAGLAPAGTDGEIPDAIGWRAGRGGSVLLECKVSRPDFLADAKKPHRANGLGTQRYFLTHGAIVDPDTELPDGWGLLETFRRGVTIRKHGSRRDADLGSEVSYLSALLHRASLSTRTPSSGPKGPMWMTQWLRWTPDVALPAPAGRKTKPGVTDGAPLCRCGHLLSQHSQYGCGACSGVMRCVGFSQTPVAAEEYGR